jgi:hypothetical protein
MMPSSNYDLWQNPNFLCIERREHRAQGVLNLFLVHAGFLKLLKGFCNQIAFGIRIMENKMMSRLGLKLLDKKLIYP